MPSRTRMVYEDDRQRAVSLSTVRTRPSNRPGLSQDVSAARLRFLLADGPCRRYGLGRMPLKELQLRATSDLLMIDRQQCRI